MVKESRQVPDEENIIKIGLASQSQYEENEKGGSAQVYYSWGGEVSSR